MELFIAWLIGVIAGFGIFSIMLINNTVGNLRVDHSDLEDDPYLFLELQTDAASLTKKKYVLMKVQAEDFITQK